MGSANFFFSTVTSFDMIWSSSWPRPPRQRRPRLGSPLSTRGLLSPRAAPRTCFDFASPIALTRSKNSRLRCVPDMATAVRQRARKLTRAALRARPLLRYRTTACRPLPGEEDTLHQQRRPPPAAPVPARIVQRHIANVIGPVGICAGLRRTPRVTRAASAARAVPTLTSRSTSAE